MSCSTVFSGQGIGKKKNMSGLEGVEKLVL